MKVLAITLILLLAVIGGFTALNWEVFNAPAELSLYFTTLYVPLGILMLGTLASLTILFLLFVVYLQSTALLSARRLSKELQTSRKLADQAEASRFTELRQFIEFSFAKEVTLNTESRDKMVTRIEQLEETVKAQLAKHKETSSSYVSEFEKQNYVKRLDK